MALVHTDVFFQHFHYIEPLTAFALFHFETNGLLFSVVMQEKLHAHIQELYPQNDVKIMKCILVVWKTEVLANRSID